MLKDTKEHMELLRVPYSSPLPRETGPSADELQIAEEASRANLERRGYNASKIDGGLKRCKRVVTSHYFVVASEYRV